MRLFTGSLMCALALLGCSSDPKPIGSGIPSAGSGNGVGGSGNASAGVGGASANGSGGSAVAGTGPIFEVDAGVDEDDDAGTACSHLNIGILGKPGSNASSNFQQWLVDSGTSAQRIQTSADQPLTAATLQPFDVVILDWLTREYTEAEASTFATWVSAGGGVAAMTGYNDEPSNDWRANSLLAPLEVAYSGPRRDGPVTKFVTHPVTAGLSSVTFVGGYGVADLGGSASIRTPIASLPDADDTIAGIAVEMGKGHAIVWADEWIEFDSEWSSQPQIAQFWVQLFAWIAPKNKCELTPLK